jgi:AraC family transcriptional regulator of adaptative response/methylated-DNA-[protein]-cysteine methyltransferase
MFKRWAGISPKRFLQYLTVENAKRMLRDSVSVLDVSLAVGLSGPSRLHDHFINIDAVTPGEYKTLGKSLKISYGFQPTPFGECLIATTWRGICFLGFVENEINKVLTLKALEQTWQNAILEEKPEAVSSMIYRIFSTTTPPEKEPIKILLHGTNFEIKVWEALLSIPKGAVISYGALSEALGHHGAARALGNAVAKNPIAYLIPCHRVLRACGDIGGYRWGAPRKRAILALEAAHQKHPC